jgi:hypothetical protein
MLEAPLDIVRAVCISFEPIFGPRPTQKSSCTKNRSAAPEKPQEAECFFARSVSSLVAQREQQCWEDSDQLAWKLVLRFKGSAMRIVPSSIETCLSLRQVRPSSDLRFTPYMRNREATYNQSLGS